MPGTGSPQLIQTPVQNVLSMVLTPFNSVSQEMVHTVTNSQNLPNNPAQYLYFLLELDIRGSRVLALSSGVKPPSELK